MHRVPFVCVLSAVASLAPHDAQVESCTEGALGDVACAARVPPPSRGKDHWLLQVGSARLSAIHRGQASSSSAIAVPADSGPLDWDTAYEQAEETLAQMRSEEKFALLSGRGWQNTYQLDKWWYVGNTPAIPRLNIPSLNMQDASWGFRAYWTEMVGTVTCWPSGLALGATWDPDAVRQFAVALGQEFTGKGANVVLGPSVEVHRVARNGRNFEYISGEDPYLGGRLTSAYVDGVQSQGVAAVVKHWVMNHQELHRRTQSSNVDDKTAWELYYGPIQAAVEAGVSAVMCSYNKVNGEPVCGSGKMFRDLKETMGFRGFVQTDWWASHGSVASGLDQEMPGSGEPTFTPDRLRRESAEAIDGAVKRILAVMHRLKLRSKCSPPNCESFLRHNVTTAAHKALARSLTAQSIVLLKNDQDTLPLLFDSVKTIAVIGSAAVAEPFDPDGKDQGENAWARGDYYSGGGSGHIAATRRRFVTKPLDGIKKRAALAGIDVLASPSNRVADAISAAQRSDVAIVVAATTSGEEFDRPNLQLDDSADRLIDAVARHAKKTIVLAQAPGVVTMPWRDSVAGILMMFLGGQETGSAWADVLFGDHAPTGRLPVMIPATEADSIPPADSQVAAYEEGMFTSYRNKDFKAAFPFGHGLTYTTFEYLIPVAPLDCSPGSLLCVRVPVQNKGVAAGQTVVQLYLEFPSTAGHPAPLLKGFQKTPVLRPGDVINVTFSLSKRDLSYYKAAPAAACCATCVGFCSPRNGNCYSSKSKHYYASCSGSGPVAAPAAPSEPWCCAVCIGSAFCSPNSGTCHNTKVKDHYKNCRVAGGAGLETPSSGDWTLADTFTAHIGESSADIRQSLPLRLNADFVLGTATAGSVMGM